MYTLACSRTFEDIRTKLDCGTFEDTQIFDGIKGLTQFLINQMPFKLEGIFMFARYFKNNQLFTFSEFNHKRMLYAHANACLWFSHCRYSFRGRWQKAVGLIGWFEQRAVALLDNKYVNHIPFKMVTKTI